MPRKIKSKIKPKLWQNECLDRLNHPKMEYYRYVYRDSERWNGISNIAGKTVVVYCEEGFGDIIQFVRYLPVLKERHCNIVLHCPLELQALFEQFEVEIIDKNCEELPKHDFHIPSMSLPFVLDCYDTKGVYLKVDKKFDLGEYQNFLKIGIAWEGNPLHSNNPERICPLFHFAKLQAKNVKLFMIKKEVHLAELVEGCDDMEIFGWPLETFMDTATLMNSMDLIVSVDTSTLHLAGALGKETYGLLSFRCDERWNVHNWYPSIKLMRQDYAGDWEGVFIRLVDILGNRLDF